VNFYESQNWIHSSSQTISWVCKGTQHPNHWPHPHSLGITKWSFPLAYVGAQYGKNSLNWFFNQWINSSYLNEKKYMAHISCYFVSINNSKIQWHPCQLIKTHLKHKEYPRLTSVITIPLSELNHESIKKASTRSPTFYAQSFHKQFDILTPSITIFWLSHLKLKTCLGKENMLS